ncbi:MAG TPA: hypothetical protein VM888_13270 [Chitinophagaceae bacterium]|nr:hypothetical protein [Chitinophagaceae bacterium]
MQRLQQLYLNLHRQLVAVFLWLAFHLFGKRREQWKKTRGW